MLGFKQQCQRYALENRQLKEELALYKSKLQASEAVYNKLKKQYISLMKTSLQKQMRLKQYAKLGRLSTLLAQHKQSDDQQEEDVIILDDDEPLDASALKQSIYFSHNSHSNQQNNIKKESISHGRQSLQQSNQKAPINLFQLFAIVEPKNDEYIATWTFPSNPTVKLQQLVSRLSTFVFSDNQIRYRRCIDDEEQSRKNEIIYGNIMEELIFTLQDAENNQVVSGRYRNPIMKSANPLEKVFCYVIVKPVVVAYEGDELVESEMMFAFLTKHPFRQFFFEMHRSVQRTVKSIPIARNQILKLMYLAAQEKLQSKIKELVPADIQASDKILNVDYSNFSLLMDRIYNTRLSDFPIKCRWGTEASELTLSIENQKTIDNSDFRFANLCLSRYEVVFLSELFHRVLLQSQVLLLSLSRKVLNDAFQILRIILKPFIWPFPVLFTLTQELKPFLESPVPLILGAQTTPKQLLKEGYVPQSGFMIFDLDMMQVYEMVGEEQKNLSHLLGYEVSRDMMTVNADERVGFLRRYLAQRLRRVKKGQVNKEKLNEFEKKLIETQMVADYYSSQPNSI